MWTSHEAGGLSSASLVGEEAHPLLPFGEDLPVFQLREVLLPPGQAAPAHAAPLGPQGLPVLDVRQAVQGERTGRRAWLQRSSTESSALTRSLFYCEIQRKDKLREHMQRMHNPDREAKKSDRTHRSKAHKTKTPTSNFESFAFKCRPCMMGFRRRGMLVSRGADAFIM